MLSNKKYIGIYQYKDELEIKDVIPAIVDKETFNKVQEVLEKNKRAPGRMKAPALYLLTGKVFCGHCGSPMVGESGTNRTGTIYNYYKCSDRKHHRGCQKQNEKKEWLEQLVVKETIKHIAKPDVIREIAHNVANLAEKESNDKRLGFFHSKRN